jgi:hypothetical protein
MIFGSFSAFLGIFAATLVIFVTFNQLIEIMI